MADLDIFVDESGEATDPDTHDYLVTLVFHKQSESIESPVRRYEQRLKDAGLPDVPFHASPLRYGTEEYAGMSRRVRNSLLVAFSSLARKLPATYATITCERSGLIGSERTERTLRRELAVFLVDHLTYLQTFDLVTVYYDGGQKIVSRLLRDVFSFVVSDSALSWAHPKYGDYRLMQLADYYCDLERADLAYERGGAPSATTNYFYGDKAFFRSHFLKQARRKSLNY